MAVPKYKKAFQDTLDANKELFDRYLELESNFQVNALKYRDDLKQIKLEVQKVLRRAENRLCARTENTKYGMYSTSLADKFWEEVRLYFPKINDIVS